MKFKSALGIVAGVILFLSAFAHSIVGWQAMSEQLARTNAPPELVQGLRIGWLFGGPVMIVFGILSIVTFVKRFRGERASTLAPVLISVAYLGFALWSAVITGGDPFFMIFAVPAVLLAIASIP